MKSARIIDTVGFTWRALGLTVLSLSTGGQTHQLMQPPEAAKTGMPPHRLPGSAGCCLGANFVAHHSQIGAPTEDGIRTIPYLVPYPVYVGSQNSPEAADPPDSNATQPSDPPESEYPSIGGPPLPPDESDSLETQFAAPEPSCPVVPPQNSADEVEAFIALKDHHIHTAIAYWVLGDTLHYITPLGIQNQVSLRLVDRSLTDRLNSNRLLQLVLPPE